MINFDDLLYSAVHLHLTSTAVITPTTSAAAATVEVIDKTSGVQLPPSASNGISAARMGLPEVATVVPAAVVRVAALTAVGLTRSDLRKAAMTLNGRVYRIENTMPRPSPGGEADGELLLVLTESIA